MTGNEPNGAVQYFNEPLGSKQLVRDSKSSPWAALAPSQYMVLNGLHNTSCPVKYLMGNSQKTSHAKIQLVPSGRHQRVLPTLSFHKPSLCMYDMCIQAYAVFRT